MSNLCPRCFKDDQAQKVSSIVSSGYVSSYSGPLQTELAQKLQIDKSDVAWNKFTHKYSTEKMIEFSKQFPSPEMGWKAKIALILFLAILCLGALALLVFSSSMVYSFSIGGIMIIALVFTYKSMQANQTPEYKEWQKKFNDTRSQYEKEANQIKQRTFRRWNNLYYCYRDDIVFLPDENLKSSPSEIMDLLMWR